MSQSDDNHWEAKSQCIEKMLQKWFHSLFYTLESKGRHKGITVNPLVIVMEVGESKAREISEVGERVFL